MTDKIYNLCKYCKIREECPRCKHYAKKGINIIVCSDLLIGDDYDR